MGEVSYENENMMFVPNCLQITPGFKSYKLTLPLLLSYIHPLTRNFVLNATAGLGVFSYGRFVELIGNKTLYKNDIVS